MAFTWTGGQYAVVGNEGTILTSPDGITWTSQSSGTTGNLNGITWNGNQFAAVGSLIAFEFAESTILTSPDGIIWTSPIRRHGK